MKTQYNRSVVTRQRMQRRRYIRPRKKNRGKGLFIIIVLFVIFYSFYKLFTADFLESTPPVISVDKKIYWNLKTPLEVRVSDNTGIKNVKISLNDGQRILPIIDENYDIPKKNVTIKVNFPKEAILDKNTKFTLLIEATDISKWNFTLGNRSVAKAQIIIDKKRPEVSILNQSYKITKGGSATVVFSAKDENLKDVYIKTNFNKIFKPTTFVKDGYYASLVAWPVEEKNFIAYVIAKDLAGNETKTRIRYYLQDKKYKESNIKLGEDFLGGKISTLYDKYSRDTKEVDDTAKFKFVNETLRAKNEELIESITSKVPEKIITNFYINPFNPLKRASAVGSFADHRFYSYNDTQVSTAWHMGLDVASTSNADIIINNPGIVVLAQDNGIYGMNLGIYYGFGLYAIYGHCSNINVDVGQQVKAGEIVAITGSTGLAFGDHLHFGVIVQGIEVRPEEWMDRKWMRDNIFKILDGAKKTILGRSGATN